MNTAQGAVISTSDIEMENGRLNIIESVMVRPTQNVYEFISTDKFTVLKQLVDDAGLQGVISKN